VASSTSTKLSKSRGFRKRVANQASLNPDDSQVLSQNTLEESALRMPGVLSLNTSLDHHNLRPHHINEEPSET
jgi:LysM repeat protein